MWPFNRLTTYVPNGTPRVKAADLNSLQDEAIEIERVVRGSRFWLCDDFTGVVTDAMWENTGGTTPTGDPSNGAFGIINLLATTGQDMRLRTQLNPLGTNDFMFVGLCAGNPGGNNGFVTFGLPSDSYTAGFYFQASFATGTWIYNYNGLTHDSGVTWNANRYDNLTCSRLGGTLQFSVNGGAVFSLLDSTNPGNIRFLIEAESTAIIGNTQQIRADLARCWIGR